MMSIALCLSIAGWLATIVVLSRGIGIRNHTITTLQDDLQSRQGLDWYVDILCRTFHIKDADPYVNGDDKIKRCCHCNAPRELGHAGTCIWVAVAPLRKKFYQS